MTQERDHGGGLDGAIAVFGGTRSDWIDLSTGINPVPYPMPSLPADAWTALPDKGAFAALYTAARKFWNVPETADVLAATGASAIIAAIPQALPKGTVHIPGPTYNEHAAAFAAAGWETSDQASHAMVAVHPNNPDGKTWHASDMTANYTVIDESFCDIAPKASLIAQTERPGTLVLKSCGKFWGLAGLRLGFVMGDPALIARLRDLLGPWQVSGPALAIGTAALSDPDWAMQTRARLAQDADRMDALMIKRGAVPCGGTDLFRLYEVDDAAALQFTLAKHHVWTRVFPYNSRWIRLGLPAPHQWTQLEAAV